MTLRRTSPAIALTGLVVAGLVATATPPAASAAPTPSAPASAAHDITVICDGVGEDVVEVTGDLASGGTARIASGPLTVVGRPGFTGKDATGRAIVVDPTGEGVTCTARQASTAKSLDQLLPAASVAEVRSSGPVTGALTCTVTVDDSVVSPRVAAGTTAAGSATRSFPFEGALRSYLASRPGAVGVAVKVPSTGRVYTYTKTRSRNVTASIVKVQVMAAVMLRAQDAGRSLTSWERSKIVPMIRQSDNTATTDLFNSIGKGPGLDRAAARLGMTGTYADPANHWGLTSTVPQDQTILMDHFSRATGVLSASNRSYGMTQMKSVVSSQRWGVSAGPPSGTVALKNGWLPRTDGWHVNSIGHSSYGRDYTIGVLTHHNPGTQSTQESTIEGVSRIVWANRAAFAPAPPPPPPPPPARGLRGDIDGDGKVDLVGVNSVGAMSLFRGNGTGSLAAPVPLRATVSDATWFGSAGDLNRDKRTDLLMRRPDGRLQLMMSKGATGWAPTKTLVTGWGSSVTSIAAGVDIDANGRLDLVMRLSTGEARHYELGDTGTIRRVRSMGTPLRWYPTILAVADMNRDGRADLRAVSASGKMRPFFSTGTGWRQGSPQTTGWETEVRLAAPGDLTVNNGNQDELVGLRADGTMHRWHGATGGGVTGPYVLPHGSPSFKHLL